MTDGVTSHQPEADNVVMEVIVPGGLPVNINRWEEYSFSSNFLLPTDGFSFTVAGDIINRRNREAIVPGAQVRCSVNGKQQVDAQIDSVDYRVSRRGGSELVIQGRDKMAGLVEAGIDPTLKFNKDMRLVDFLTEVFTPFGYTADSFVGDNDLNRGVMSGNEIGTRTRKRDAGGAGGLTPGKVKTRALRGEKLHELRPYPNEGAFDFAARVCKRLGLWLWTTANGQQIVVGKPEFDQKPIYSLYRRFQGFNNILDASVRLDISEQPSIIFADGFSGGSEYGHARIKAYAINPLIDADNSELLKKYLKSGAVKVEIPFTPSKKYKLPPRAMFFHDDDAKEQVHIENFVKRQLAMRLKNSLAVSVTVKGHEQDGKNWTVDTCVNFMDEVSGVNEVLYVLARKFLKSRQGGTLTELQLIRPYSLSL